MASLGWQMKEIDLILYDKVGFFFSSSFLAQVNTCFSDNNNNDNNDDDDVEIQQIKNS